MGEFPESVMLADLSRRKVRVRLLVEADRPEMEVLALACRVDQDYAGFLRMLLDSILAEPGVRITEFSPERRRPSRSVELICPDGTAIAVSSTGRPSKELRKWKDQGYVVDWQERKLVKAQ